MLAAPKPRRPTLVLHGRVVQRGDGGDGPSRQMQDSSPRQQRSSKSINSGGGRGHSSVRDVMERKSTFSTLSRETQIFGRMVSDLEKLLADSGDSPEAAWRARILMRSTQETDKELWEKLFNYEKTLHGHTEDGDLRKAQTACMKLHRDFKRIHKSLVLALSRFESRQKAEISRLGAVGWTSPTNEKDHEDLEDEEGEPVEEDYYDRALREREEFNQSMRAREISEINRKMHTVNDIYNEIAEMVDEQQEQVDDLEEEVDYAKFNVQAQQDPSLMDAFFCGGMDSTVDTTVPGKSKRKGRKDDDGIIDWGPLFACGDVSMAAESLKKSYGLMREYDKNPIIRPNEFSSEDSDSDDDSPVAVEPPVRHRRERSSGTNVSPTARLRLYQRQKQLGISTSPPPPNAEVDENLRVSEEFHWMMPFETLTDDVKAVHSDLLGWGKNIISPRYEEEDIPPSQQKRML